VGERKIMNHFVLKNGFLPWRFFVGVAALG
jgi:hypothetical protein